MLAANPFKPTFGATPPLLAGRDDLIDQFVEGLEDGPGSTVRATIYTGARGVGKTVMLNAVEDRARERGWLVISETATTGFVERIVKEHLPGLLADHDPSAVKRHITGVTAPFSASGATHLPSMGLRTQVALLTDVLAENGTGLLITLDEVHKQQTGELRELAAAIQHAFREDRELAFVAAGLPSAVSDMLNDEVITFLRRADRNVLGAVELPDVARAIREPIELTNREIADDACQMATSATRGYPFMIQLVGYHIWRLHPDTRAVSVADVEMGVARARRRLGALVHEPTIADLSDIDRTFLLAMARDEGPSKMKDIASRLNVDTNYASQYRLRLLDAEIIRRVAHGKVDFAVPYLREYLREHAASTLSEDLFLRSSSDHFA